MGIPFTIDVPLVDGIPVDYRAEEISAELAKTSRCYGCGLRGLGFCVKIRCEPWERQDKKRVIYVKDFHTSRLSEGGNRAPAE